MKSFLITLSMTLVALLPLGSNAQDAREIIRKTDEKRRGEAATSSMTIRIVRPTWTREMEVKTWSLGTEYSLILITSPARDKGTVFLKRDKEIWNWLPAIERNVKLPPSMMMQSWMGSDFTNDDLIKESSVVDDYTHRIVGDSIISGRSCWLIELIPKPDAAVVWGKVLNWIDKREYIELRTEMYDEDGYLVNVVKFGEVKDLGGRMLPSVMEFVPAEKEGHKTEIRYHEVDYEALLGQSFFSLQNMKRVR